MKRYVFDDIKSNGTLKFDVVIVGSGLAGLYTAMHVDERLTCAILTKEGVDISNSWLAQGGIAAAMSQDDNPELHFEDTFTAGAGLNDPDAVKVLVDEGPNDVQTLINWKVPFDLSEDGDLQIGQEGGHRRRRIVHAGGDATGRETVKVLAAMAARKSNITFLQHAFFVDILQDEKGVCGMVIDDGGYKLIAARNICICTGGIGQVYRFTTNPEVATGDGIAAAIRAGAKARHMEFIQFHPTAMYDEGESKRSFLVSEAVRGDGAILRNDKGEAFMQGQHPMADLAPRDVVSRSILHEMLRTGAKHVWLDATCMTTAFFSKRFPTIYSECVRRGIDPGKDYIPVCPVQHFMVGGIKTDLNGMTDIRGLYAVGEAAYTGVHGANRLASNSMLECLVFGRRAAGHMNDTITGREIKDVELPQGEKRTGVDFDPAAVKREIQSLMYTYGGIIRTEEGLTKGVMQITTLLEKLDSAPLKSKRHMEALNMTEVSLEILKAALARKESIGTHYREIKQ